MADEISVKLLPPSAVEHDELDYNQLTVPNAILECMSGEFKGNTRVIIQVLDSAKMPEKYRNLTSVRMLTVTGYDRSGTYPIAKDDDINYNWNRGVIDFSSHKVKYRIRAIQPTDKLYS
jgi:hypothetical protein